MNGRIYDPRLGRMLSPDPVTQAPENGQNYNRYTYADNNPLKYTDPSGFAGEMAAGCTWAATDGGVSCGIGILGAASFLGIDFGDLLGFGGNGCDKTCKERHAALAWCRSESWCYEAIQGTKEKFRRRSALAIMEATATGQSWYIENGRAFVGDQLTSTGEPVQSVLVLGASVAGGLLDGASGWLSSEFMAAVIRSSLLATISTISGSQESGIPLFRVMNDSELTASMAAQGLVPDVNNFGKETWLTITDAEWFASLNINQLMNVSIVYMRVSSEVMQLGTQGSDIGHIFWHFDNSVLGEVNQSIREHGGLIVIN